jgi:hypothetical protein
MMIREWLMPRERFDGFAFLSVHIAKVEHFRMTKGDLGVALREKLLEDKVLSTAGTMYILDPDALGAKVGVGFQDLKLKRYPAATKSYLSSLLAG